ncbi:MAG: hypothetical protein ABID63_10290 [Pseudomonadota bacterium]
MTCYSKMVLGGVSAVAMMMMAGVTQAQQAPGEVRIIGTEENVELNGSKGQLASLANPESGSQETAVVMETAELSDQPLMIALRFTQPLGETEMSYFGEEKQGQVEVTAQCTEVLIAEMPDGRQVAQGNDCTLVDYE